MPKYMLLIYGPARERAPEERSEQWPVWMHYTQSLRDAGVLLHGAPLYGVDTATTVRVRDGQHQVVDGPYAETKEFLAGYYLLECPDREAALKHAARMPNLEYGSTEVRPVLEYGIATADQAAPMQA